MTILEAMQARHSVRSYLAKPLEAESKQALKSEIDAINREAGLHFQLVTDEPKAFSRLMARYGKFSGVTNYIALAGRKSPELDERCGYYGELLVLLAQQLGGYDLQKGPRHLPAGPHGHESAEVHPHSGQRQGEVKGRDGLLCQNRPGNCQISL